MEKRTLTLGSLIDQLVADLAASFPDCRIAFSVLEGPDMRVLRSVEPEGMPTLQGWHSENVFELGPPYFSKLRRGDTTTIADTNASVLVNPELAEVCREFQMAAVIEVPVSLANEFVGLLSVDSPRPREWNEDEITRVQVRASLIAGFLEYSSQGVSALPSSLDQQALAHELNNTLTAVRLGLEMALEDLRRGASVASAIEEITRALDATQFAVDILARNKDQHGLPANRADLDVDEIVGRALALVGPDAVSAQVELTSDQAGGVCAYVDELTTVQVVVNLLLNAIRAARERNRKHQGCVHVTSSTTEGAVAITVEDNGGGIPASDREKIFLPGFTTRVGREGGMGLYICRYLAASQGGSLRLESSEAGRTRFTLHLPLSQAEVETESLP